MPMTEMHTYQLSTAENELGVVIAHSDEGKGLIYLSRLLSYFNGLPFYRCSHGTNQLDTDAVPEIFMQGIP